MFTMSVLRGFACVALLLLIQNIDAKSANEEITNDSRTSSNNSSVDQTAQRRQDGGFDFMNYFMGNSAQQQQQQQQQVPQPEESRTPQITVQQQHLIQQQQLQQHQLRQQEQLKLLQQQQLLELQQQQQHQAPRAVHDLSYQDNAIPHQYPQQQQVVALNREGGYVGVGNAYGDVKPREIGINLGGGKKVIEVGNILTLLPRIFNVLNAGGKVMFGVELGNNFYFGPVGAKPLGKPVVG